MVGMSASVIFRCTIKVRKISSGSDSPTWSQKRAVKRLCVFDLYKTGVCMQRSVVKVVFKR